jgi:integrase
MGMPRRAAGLTARGVQSKPAGVHADGGGLYLRVTPSGARMWVFRYQIGGQRHDIGLGSVDSFTLAEARDRAIDARRQVARGIDPLGEKRAHRAAAAATVAKAMTFSQCAESFIRAHEAGWRNTKHGHQVATTLATYAYPVFGDLPIADVDVALVMQVLEPIWSTKVETASRTRARIEAVLDWATVRGYRSGENPARWKGHLGSLLPQKRRVARIEHHAALPYGEIGDFMLALRADGSVSARCLEYVILTATRSGEARAARWQEIDLKAKLWTIPAERMKAGKEHRVPLVGRAVEIIEAMAAVRTSDFVFAGAKSGACIAERTMPALLENRMGRRDLTVHGFRSTFSDWCAERTAYPAEVREMALAHAVGSQVEAAYRRGDLFEKRRQLMQAWGDFCTAPPAEGEVVPLRGWA